MKPGDVGSMSWDPRARVIYLVARVWNQTSLFQLACIIILQEADFHSEISRENARVTPVREEVEDIIFAGGNPQAPPPPAGESSLGR
jgi:hypothetical protein